MAKDADKAMQDAQKQLAEMQKQMEQQLAHLPKEQRDLVMQSFAAQQASLTNTYAGLVAGAEDGDDDGEGNEAYEALHKEFVARNKPSPEHAKYLPIGALLIGTWDEPYETLALMLSDKDDVMGALENGWGIRDRKEGLKMMEALMDGRHAKKFKAVHDAMRSGKKDKVDPDDAEDYEGAVEAVLEILELPKSYIEKCETLYAWDLERVGYLARLFVHVGFITEAEAWEWMKKAGAKIKENFKDWESYIVSILIGRAFAMGLAEEPFAVAYDLLTDNKNFLDAHPIKNL